MGNIFLIARHDLMMTLRDRGAVLWMFVLPLVFSLVFGLFMSGNNDPSNIKVGLSILDQDQSELSRGLVEELQGGGFLIHEISKEKPETDEPAIRTLILPAGLEEMVSAGEEVKLELIVSPDASGEATLVAKARIFKAITRILGRLIRQESNLEFLPSPTGEVLVRVESKFAGRSEHIPTGFSQSFPGNSVMFVMLVALSWGSASLGRERDSGMLRRLATAPLSRSGIVLGKIGGRFLSAALQVSFLVLVITGARIFGYLDIGGNMLIVWGILLLFAACIAPLGVALGAFFTDPDRASSVGVACTMALAGIGGCWWPLGIVSGPLKTLAFFTPTAWTMKALSAIISFGQGLPEILPFLGFMLLFGGLFTLMATRLLRIE